MKVESASIGIALVGLKLRLLGLGRGDRSELVESSSKAGLLSLLLNRSLLVTDSVVLCVSCPEKNGFTFSIEDVSDTFDPCVVVLYPEEAYDAKLHLLLSTDV